MMEYSELIALVDNAAFRRLWLLHNALHCLRLDRALDLARAAEGFVMGERDLADTRVPEQSADMEGRVAAGQQSLPELGDEALEDSEAAHWATTLDSATKTRAVETGILQPTAEIAGVVAPGQQSVCELGDRAPADSETAHCATTPDPATKKPAALDLTREQRARLIARLAEGARNAELASEFGLSRKQVQGIRMGCAREIAKRREHIGEASPTSETDVTASVEEVVRYLRQQDDVVVPQEDGGFLVNGRFHMGISDLVDRANRMRIRQQKPAFEVQGPASAHPTSFARANGHPVFWREAPGAPQSGT